MPDHEVRAFYDHEIEEGRSTGRRPVADWGVGEELFDRMPSRRRFRSSDGGARREAHATDTHRRDVHPRERRFATAETRPVAEAQPRPDRPRSRAASPPEAAVREAAPLDRPAQARADAEPPTAAAIEPIDRSAAPAPVPAAPEPIAPSPGALESPTLTEHVELDAVDRPATGRRTVVIRGRGAEPASMPHRSRPPRTVGERLGPRPDRAAAWAVALGVLLILIAILTAH